MVRIRYEKVKPNVDVKAFDTSENSNTGKTTKKEFISSLPDGFSDVLLPYIEDWERKGYIFYWGTTGFSVRCLQKGKPKTILDFYPTSMNLLTDRRCESGKLPKEICKNFQNSVRNIPAANRIISENRVYLYYKDIAIGEFSKLLFETDKALNKIAEFFKNSSRNITCSIPKKVFFVSTIQN